LLHQPTYWDNIILPNGQTPNGQIDSAIDEFIGVQSPFLPPANSNQFNHKMWQFPWVGGMNQSIYKNPQGNGPFAQAAPPNITFSGPLIKIDNIKGGDGVTPEELKNAVAQAVTETLTYISKPTWQS
jgi:hypothetical protein